MPPWQFCRSPRLGGRDYRRVGNRARAAQLAANFMLSREAEQFLTKRGRLPTRTDIETNPPGVIDALQQKKVIVTISSAEQQKKMQATFNELFRSR